MNDLAQSNSNIPVKIDELQKYILIGRERLVAVRAEIRAIDKLGIAKSVHAQKLAEAQDLAEAVLDAEVRIGELISALPTAPGTRTDLEHTDSTVQKSVSKRAIIETAGMTVRTAQRYETLAAHPDEVARLKAAARQAGEVISRSSVLAEIQQYGKVKRFVQNNSGEAEWYTDAKFIESARKVMGSIDLDPASSAAANETVRATHYFTIEDDGLKQEWTGRIWLNPPYSKAYLFTKKLLESKSVTESICLMNNCTETQWFYDISSAANAIVFTKGRTTFYRADGTESSRPLQGQAIIYIGPHQTEFLKEFSQYGWACIPYHE